MEQGFSSEGFALPAATVERSGNVVRGSARSGHAPAQPHNPNATLSAAEVTAKGAALYGNAAKSERAAEENLRGIQGKLMLPGMLQLGAMLATPLMWVTQKMPRVKTVIGSALKASSHALDKTNIMELGQLPANYMTAVAEQASEAGVAKWATGATAKSAALKVSGEAVQGKVAEFAKPVTNVIISAFEKLGQTSFAKAIPSVVKNTLGKARGASVFQVLMTAGVAAGVAATMVGSRAEKKETKAAFDNLMADMGGDANSPYAKAVKQTYATKKNAGLVKTGLELAGGMAEGVMWAMPGAGGMKMMGAMMVPQLCQNLVPESPTLGAYVALSKADAGELKIDAAARTDLVKQLIAIVPNVAANGGQYNRLVTPLAKDIVSKNLSTKQVVQLLSDEKAFTELVGEIFAKQQAEKAAKTSSVGHGKAPAANDAHVGREPVKAVAQDVVVAKSPEAANAPSMKLAVGQKMHQGRVAEHQLQVG